MTIILLLIIGLIGGSMSGLLGIGGGVVMIPLLTMLLGLSQHNAQGISIALFVLPVGLFSAYNYYKNGYIQIEYVIFLAIGFALGSFISSKYSVGLSENIIKQVFGIILIIIGIKYIFIK